MLNILNEADFRQILIMAFTGTKHVLWKLDECRPTVFPTTEITKVEKINDIALYIFQDMFCNKFVAMEIGLNAAQSMNKCHVISPLGEPPHTTTCHMACIKVCRT